MHGVCWLPPSLRSPSPSLPFPSAGSNVLLHLAREYPNYKLICLDKLDVCSSLNNLDPIAKNPQFTFVHGDICSADLVRHICQSNDVATIMHFASQTHVDTSFGNSLNFTYSNVQGTHTLLESVKSLGGQIRRFIHVSTDEVYGEQNAESDRSREHETPLNPTNPYAATKAAAEFIVKSYRSSFNLPTIITRGNNVYGPRQYPEKLIPKVKRTHLFCFCLFLCLRFSFSPKPFGRDDPFPV